MHSIKTILHNIYIYIDTHTIKSLLFSGFSNIRPQYIYISATPFILLLSFFVYYGTFAHMGVLPFLFHLSCSLRHIKFSFIFLFTVSCDRAAQSITLKLEIKAKNQKPQAKNIYTHKINIDTHTNKINKCTPQSKLQ